MTHQIKIICVPDKTGGAHQFDLRRECLERFVWESFVSQKVANSSVSGTVGCCRVAYSSNSGSPLVDCCCLYKCQQQVIFMFILTSCLRIGQFQCILKARPKWQSPRPWHIRALVVATLWITVVPLAFLLKARKANTLHVYGIMMFSNHLVGGLLVRTTEFMCEASRFLIVGPPTLLILSFLPSFPFPRQ